MLINYKRPSGSSTRARVSHDNNHNVLTSTNTKPHHIAIEWAYSIFLSLSDVIG
jgi:hypothetical protein